jgi:8-oxo-dGTP pyrophosphatase MutT (NUDIX family)
VDYIDLARRALANYEPRPLTTPAPRDAGVLVLLYHHAGADRVLLTRRTDTVEHHKGQISFPGGGRHDADEDLATTALRETWEEVGVHPDDVEIIGRLDEVLTISDFRVAPYVGVLHRIPYAFVPSEIEVAEVLEVPIAHLLDPANADYETRLLPDGREVLLPAYVYGDQRIWGATARMLESFLDLLRRAMDAEAAESHHEGTVVRPD